MNSNPTARQRHYHGYAQNRGIMHSSPTSLLLKFFGASLIIGLFALVLMAEVNIL